jgi:hypothetical protein
MKARQDCAFGNCFSAKVSSEIYSRNMRTTEQQRQQQGQQCSTCLYTGVATCTGLSAYFFKVAHFDLPTHGSQQIMLKATKDKRFLLAFGSCWAIAGAYRFYLG